MSRNRVYSARPINTYTGSAHVGDAYVAYVAQEFPGSDIVDPNSPEIQRHAQELKALYSIDPETGLHSEQYYNEHGGAKVMEYFTNEVVEPCVVGVGLMLPVKTSDGKEFMIGAGVGAELLKMHELGRPIYVVSCCSREDELSFKMFCVSRVEENKTRSTNKSKVFTFFTGEGLIFEQMTVEETRARMYTKNPDGTWNREVLQPYLI